MKNNILEYKGYHTRIEFDAETSTLRGKIEGIGDFVDFSSDDLSNVECEFHAAVDDYLEFCEEVGKEPDKEYKGTFNVRVTPELHKQLAVKAYKEEQSLNAVVEKAIELYLKGVTNSIVQERTIYMLPPEFMQKTPRVQKPIMVSENFLSDQNTGGNNIIMSYRGMMN